MTSRNPLHPNLIISQYTGYKKQSWLDTFQKKKTYYNSHYKFQLAISKISLILAKVQELKGPSKFQ